MESGLPCPFIVSVMRWIVQLFVRNMAVADIKEQQDLPATHFHF